MLLSCQGPSKNEGVLKAGGWLLDSRSEETFIPKGHYMKVCQSPNTNSIRTRRSYARVSALLFQSFPIALERDCAERYEPPAFVNDTCDNLITPARVRPGP